MKVAVQTAGGGPDPDNIACIRGESLLDWKERMINSEPALTQAAVRDAFNEALSPRELESFELLPVGASEKDLQWWLDRLMGILMRQWRDFRGNISFVKLSRKDDMVAIFNAKSERSKKRARGGYDPQEVMAAAAPEQADDKLMTEEPEKEEVGACSLWV